LIDGERTELTAEYIGAHAGGTGILIGREETLNIIRSKQKRANQKPVRIFSFAIGQKS